MISDKVNLALKVASKAHRNQTRKGTDIPYIAHPVAVAMIISEYTTDENTVVAGILHDILEDVKPTVYSETDMRNDFGDEIVKIVKDVSEDKTAGEPEKPWIERKRGYLAHLDSVEDERSLIVSTADKIHNLTDILEEYERVGDSIWQKFNASKDDELWFYNEFLKIVEKKQIPEQIKIDLTSLVNRLKDLVRQR
ncbi:HD domain-containing protein [Candidatus Saccharibacteria bacterium]|nr:HD domain-containing protein [Candidatus Saccharibacteria bacterium]